MVARSTVRENTKIVRRNINTDASSVFQNSELSVIKRSNKEDIYNAIKSLPADKRIDSKYLKDIMTFINGLVLGDEISTYSLMNSVRLDYAKEALKGLANSFYEKELGELLTQRESLLGEVSKLSKEKDSLTEKIESLSTQEMELQNSIRDKSEELDKIKDDIIHIINNKTAIIISEVNETQKRLNSEIDELKSNKKSLEESLDELKKQVENYKKAIVSSQNNDNDAVEWIPIKEADPIYSVRACDMQKYLDSLIRIYISKTGKSKDEALDDFRINCPGIFSIIYESKELTSYFNGFPIKSLIGFSEGIKIRDIVSSIKLPSYTKVNSVESQAQSYPVSYNSLINELNYQKMIIEAMTKQKVAEAQLKMVLDLLKTVLPEGMNYESIISQMSLPSIGLNKYIEAKTDDDPNLTYKNS